jgi:hypothetical protein
MIWKETYMSFVQMKQDDQARPGDKHCLLAHGFNEKELTIVNALAKALNIPEVIIIESTMQENVIQDIIDGKATKNALVTPLLERVVIFNDLSDYDIHQFIGGYKETGLSRPIYAASTVNSRKWTFKAWLEELMEERAAIAAQRQNGR